MHFGVPPLDTFAMIQTVAVGPAGPQYRSRVLIKVWSIRVNHSSRSSTVNLKLLLVLRSHEPLSPNQQPRQHSQAA